MLDKGDLLTLSNGKEYIVINQLQLDGKYYVYLVAKDGSTVAVCLLQNEELTTISDGEFLQILLKKFKKQQES